MNKCRLYQLSVDSFTAAVVILLLSLPGRGFAEEPAGANAPLLAPVEVTVPPQSERSKSVTFISREQMDGDWALNLNDYLFSMHPGIGTARRSNLGFMGPGSGFWIRGLVRERVAVFVDGIPSQVNNHFHPLVDQYTPDLVERVEITRGTSGVLHGASAAGGVIDIFTYNPPPGPSGYAFVSNGSHSTREYQGRAAYGFESGTFQFSGTKRNTDGYRKNQDFNATTLNAKGTLDLGSAWELGVRGGRTDANIENPGRVGAPSLSKSTQDPRNAAITLDRKTATQNSFGAFYWNGAKVRSLRNGGGASTNFTRFKEDEFGLRLKQQWLKRQRNTYTAGFDAVKFTDERKNGPGTKEEDNTESFYSPYVQMTYPLRDTTDVDGGARVTYSNQFGWDLSPEVGIVEHLDKSLAVRARVGKSFRVPRVNDVNQPFGGTTISNDNLDPERFWNVETGLNKRTGKFLFFEATEFDVAAWYMNGDNLIQTVGIGGGLSQLKNTGDFNNKGVETSFDMIVNNNLSVFVGGSLSNLDKDILQVPEKTVDAGFKYRWKRIKGNVTSRYATDAHDVVSGKKVSLDSYYVADAHVAYELAKGTEVMFDVVNISDKNYETIAGFPQVPRSYFVSLRSYLQ